MAGYRLELYNKDNTTKFGRLVYVSNVWMVDEIEGESSLRFTINEKDELYDNVEKAPGTNEGIFARNYIRVVDIDGSNSFGNSESYRPFIIVGWDESYNNGVLQKTVICEGLKLALMDNIVPYKRQYDNITLATALTLALSDGSGFSSGTVDEGTTNTNSILLDWPNSLEALQQIIDIWTYTLDSNEVKFFYQVLNNKNVNIRKKADYGSDNYFYIHIDRNMKGITKHLNAKNLINKVYGVGADGMSMERSGHKKYFWEYVDSQCTAAGGNDYLVDSGLVTDDLHNGMSVYIDGGTGLGQWRTITDTVGSTKRLYVTPNWATNPDATSTYIIGYLDETNTNMSYELGVPDGNSDMALINSEIVIGYSGTINWTSGADGDYVRIHIKLELRNTGDTTIAQIIHRVEKDYDISTYSGSFSIDVGLLKSVDDIKITLNSVSWIDNGGSPAGSVTLTITDVQYILGNNLLYVSDATSITQYGTIEGKYENPQIEDVHNLINEPALDGTYTSGVCAQWTKEGTPTPTENTTAAYIRNGIKSQKIIADDVDEGISQVVGIEPNTSYSAYFQIYVDASTSGGIECLITDGTTETSHITSGGGWLEVTIENFSYDATSITLKILSNGAAVTFYVDSVQITKGTEGKTFYDGDSADVLLAEAQKYLDEHKDPETSYDLDLLNLYEHDRATYSSENFIVGDTVKVVDRDLSIASNLLVTRKEFDPLNPVNCKVKLEKNVDRFRRGLGYAIMSLARKSRRP